MTEDDARKGEMSVDFNKANSGLVERIDIPLKEQVPRLNDIRPSPPPDPAIESEEERDRRWLGYLWTYGDQHQREMAKAGFDRLDEAAERREQVRSENARKAMIADGYRI